MKYKHLLFFVLVILVVVCLKLFADEILYVNESKEIIGKIVSKTAIDTNSGLRNVICEGKKLYGVNMSNCKIVDFKGSIPSDLKKVNYKFDAALTKIEKYEILITTP